MNDQSFDILEYRQLLALVRAGAQTAMGLVRIETIRPLDDRAILDQSLATLTECLALRRQGITWSFSEINAPDEALARLSIGGTGLDPFAILTLAQLCEQAMSARAAI